MERATHLIDMQQIKNILQAQKVKYKQLKDIDGVYTIFINVTASENNIVYQALKVMIVPEQIEDESIRQLVFYRTYCLHNNTKISEEFKNETHKQYIQSYKNLESAKIGVLKHLEDFGFSIKENKIINFIIED